MLGRLCIHRRVFLFSAHPQICFVLPHSISAGCVRLSGGLPAGADPTAASVQDRSGGEGHTAAAVCGNAAGHTHFGGHPGSRSADAAVGGTFGQSGVRVDHRRCCHCHRAYEHAGDLCGKHHGHRGVRHALFVRACYAAASGCGAGCRSCRPVGLAGAFFAVLLSLSGTACLQVPYLAAHPFPQRPMAEDGIIRRNYRRLSAHDFNIWQKREGK